MIFNYYSLNYEICYFSLNYKYSSLFLIGGKKYEIFFPRKFCSKIKRIVSEAMANYFSDKPLPELLEYVESYYDMIRAKSSLSRIGLKYGYKSVYYQCLGNEPFSRRSPEDYLRNTLEIPEDLKSDINLFLTGLIGNEINIKDYIIYKNDTSNFGYNKNQRAETLAFIYLDKESEEEDM